MAFWLKVVTCLLLVVAAELRPLKEASVERTKEEERRQVKRNATSNFVFFNKTDTAKGLEYLKKKFPDIDWSLITSSNTKKELVGNSAGRHENRKRNATSKFVFFNKTDTAQGLAHLKTKYPDIDFSLVGPLPTTSTVDGKREPAGNVIVDIQPQSRKTSSTKIVATKRLPDKKTLEDLESSLTGLVKDVSEILKDQNDEKASGSDDKTKPSSTSKFPFVKRGEEAEDLAYLKEKFSNVDSSQVTKRNKKIDA